MPVWMSFALFGAGVALSWARVRSAQARRLMKGAETPLTPLESLRVGSLTQKIKVMSVEEGTSAGPGPARPWQA